MPDHINEQPHSFVVIALVGKGHGEAAIGVQRIGSAWQSHTELLNRGLCSVARQQAAGRPHVVVDILRREFDRPQETAQTFRGLLQIEVQLPALLPCAGVVRIDFQSSVQIRRCIAVQSERKRRATRRAKIPGIVRLRHSGRGVE